MCSPAEMTHAISGGKKSPPARQSHRGSKSDTLCLPSSLSPEKGQTSVGHLTHHEGDPVWPRSNQAWAQKGRAGKHMAQGTWDDIQSSQFPEKKTTFLLDLLNEQERKGGII